MSRFKGNQPAWLNVLSYIGVYAISITLMFFSYSEEFYQGYIAGSAYLVWAVYILPWIIVIANTLHLLDHTKVISVKRIFDKIFRRKK